LKIIKLHTISSTNDYLKKLSGKEDLSNFTVVVADYQTRGKGQMGSVWESEKGMNLMFSTFVDSSFLSGDRHFYLNVIASLALYDVLKGLLITKLKIKWPNDILSDNKKLCGILVENSFKNNKINHSIVGIGLNVNQVDFNEKFNASSLKALTGIHYSLDELLTLFIRSLQHYYALLKASKYDLLLETYSNQLFRKNKPSTFKDVHGLFFTGYIQGVTKNGKLEVLLEDQLIKAFDLKEITLIY
jgi:BirA family biotin operon repressor/biotin-[acetyl-CoA-carboxylase] ligase